MKNEPFECIIQERGAGKIKYLEEENMRLRNKLEEKHKQLIEENEILKKALKLAREYMFNVMCADDVPFESWFIECAKNDWETS